MYKINLQYTILKDFLPALNIFTIFALRKHTNNDTVYDRLWEEYPSAGKQKNHS